VASLRTTAILIPLLLGRTEAWRRDGQRNGVIQMQLVTGRCCCLWSYRVTLLPTFRLSSPANPPLPKSPALDHTFTSSPEADVVTMPCCFFSILCLSLSLSLSYSACCPPPSPLLQCTQLRTGAMLWLYVLTSINQNYIMAMDTDETKNFLSECVGKWRGEKKSCSFIFNSC
jgi:hypothetical protein